MKRAQKTGPASSARRSDKADQTNQPAKKQLPLDPNPATPRDKWNDYFSKRQPKPVEVRKLILTLHNRKQYEEVIAVIEGALINGQSQPWMYDVLAINMRLAKYPKKDVERVLLSRVDFTATDIPSMLFSAAYLTRFDARERAMALYRQASALDPARPEPYVLGLKLAKQMRSIDGVRWAAPGVLRHVWTNNHGSIQRDAENAATDVITALQRRGETAKAAEFEKEIAAARQRDMRLRLDWNGEGDLDLLVTDPSGAVCSAVNPRTQGGGILVHDGAGPRQENCYEEYICPSGLPGTYKVRVRHIRGNIVGKRATLIATRYIGSKYQSENRITVEPGQDDVLLEVPLSRGRRQTKGLIPEKMEIPQQGARRTIRRSESTAAARRFQSSRGQSVRNASMVSDPNAAGFGAVGFQPIVSIIPEGISLGAAAIISADRRFVRLTVNPTFSTISDVATFSFVNGGPN